MIDGLSSLITKLSLVLGTLSVLAATPAEYNITPAFPDQASVRSYVSSEAAKAGVSTYTALFILDHESQDCGFGRDGHFNPAIRGKEPDGGYSYGCWQFNDKNPDFDKTCSVDFICSTKTAMEWLKAGKENKWSVWRMRKEWFSEK